jgi:cyclic lactone autoinducer peptide
MKLALKSLCAALLLTATASAASAQTGWYYYEEHGPMAQGYYGTPYGGGPQYGEGPGDQYGYGPGYSYAPQAPPDYYRYYFGRY